MANDTDLIILDGCTFFYSNENGDVEARGPSGFFYRDVRHLTVWKVTVDGREVQPISSRRIDYYSARVVATTSNQTWKLCVDMIPSRHRTSTRLPGTPTPSRCSFPTFCDSQGRERRRPSTTSRPRSVRIAISGAPPADDCGL